jgi:hypothetical protein
MINADMRLYNFFSLGTNDEYGQQAISNEPVGQIKMAVNISSQSVQDNINYSNCQYIGLTHDKNIKDSYIIDLDGKLAKVLYVNPKGRMKQVFMADYEN